MRTITRGDFLRCLRKAGVAGRVEATQALEAFRLYMASEFPEISVDDYEPLFVQDKVLVIRSHNAALQHALAEREVEITHFITQAAGIKVQQLRFRP
ncbi:MAG: hypothetical protein ACD_43C00174G0001 [uncultured bacterium]|nr:MAG: hypothetical protein ACD_43C00174G0001 [uncultured bacterium]